jgi:hypothetical protein
MCVLWPAYNQVLVNEVMSSNGNTIADEDGDFSDWIELYNPGGEEIDLLGYTLTDDFEILDKWTFPEIVIPEKGYLLIFASDKNRVLVSENTYLHTNFKIDREGEHIYLINPAGNIVDSAPYVYLETDISYGRDSGNPDIWNYYQNATPEDENIGPAFAGIVSERPEFSINGGLFEGILTVEISSDSNLQLRFTLDGTPPDIQSPVYSSSITIEKSTVVKARLFKENYLPGPISAQSYIKIDDVLERDLPILSISAEPRQLFSDSEGLFNNMPGELEKEVHIQLYDPDGSLALDSDAGMKIFGNESGEGYDYQQSLSFFARSKYGNGSFRYRIFKEKNIKEFESFIVRNNNSEFDLYDVVGSGLVQDILPVQAYQPVIVFINGQYWGAQHMMEKINEHYLASNFNVDPDNVDLLNAIETSADYYIPEWAMSGDIEHYKSLIDFLRANDLSRKVNYDKVKTMIDIDNFATYQCTEIFFGNQDWPGNNMKWWRSRTEEGKWRWIVFDTDAGLGAWVGYTDNTLFTATQPDGPESDEDTWPNPPWSTFILRNLLKNEEFENFFIAKLCDLLATNFDPEVSIPWVDVRAEPLMAEIPNHYERWELEPFYWFKHIRDIKYFLEKRPDAVLEHFREFFDLDKLHMLHIDTENRGGNIYINNQVIREYPWTGKYFEDLVVEVTARTDIGFKFSGWGDIEENQEEVKIRIDRDLSLIAKFDPIPGFERVVINEICYSSTETNDWIELFNPTDQSIDLTGWEIMDDDNSPFIFSPGTLLREGEFIVVCRDQNAFAAKYSNVESVGNIEFGLSKRGDEVSLYNDSGVLIDKLEYKVVYPWPDSKEAISLLNPDMNNMFPGNWQNTDDRKSPGSYNYIIHDNNNQEDPASAFTLYDAYPNPANNTTTINYELRQKDRIILNLFNSQAQLVSQLVNKEQLPGFYSTEVDGTFLGPGIYYYSLQSTLGKETKKIILYR